MKKDKEYKFSVVIPIYNVEKYLEETIISVINQTIGFEENIEIILVNDESPDNSEEICLKYKNLYPNNVTYIKQKNGGVSSARNTGLQQATGKYVSFLDSDDKWEKEVFQKAYDMFEKNPKLDVIGVRVKFFEARQTFHSLDYKFEKDCVVNIFNNYDYIQLSVASAFIRRTAMKGVMFDTRLKYSEDSKFLMEIILKSQLLGIIASSLYLYRKRHTDDSAIQRKNANQDWYTVTPLLGYLYCCELSIKLFGYVIPYVQYLIAYEYQYRIREAIPLSIDKKILENYIEISHKLINYVDDDVFTKLRNTTDEYRTELACFKYQRDIKKEFIYDSYENCFSFNGYKLMDFNTNSFLKINSIDFVNNEMIIRGSFRNIIDENDYKIFVVNGKEKIDLKFDDTEINVIKAFNQKFMSSRGFSLKISCKNFKNLHFEMLYKEKYIIKLLFSTGVNSKINAAGRASFKYNKKIYYVQNGSIKCKKSNIINKLYFGCRTYNTLIIKRKYKAIILRIMYHFLKMFNHKKIWIISDRPPVANDNGYAFFKYLNEKVKDKKIKSYFVINKNSSDFEKVKKTGKYLIYNSIKYKLYFLMASKVISSQFDEWTNNPFGKSYIYYQNLLCNDFIFLQHGIIKDDLSGLLNNYEKSFKIFVTSAEGEYKSIVNGKYGYNDTNIVKLTGLPRYDLLEDKKEKTIVIMPTWRAHLACKVDLHTGVRVKNNSFKKSNYFQYYNELINDKKLLEVMKEKGYKGIFVVHPSHANQWEDFDANDVFLVNPNIANYSDIFKKSSLLITDYSSVAFDFAYLKKPVIYTQFDKKEFFASHTYKEGYFSYEKDGFGPVINNYDDTVKEIIDYIKNDCKIQSKYIKRIESFYAFHDKNNCKRVYEEIKKLDKKS